MKMKGHTVIELTNEETGEKEIHEDDNLVTNALAVLANNVGGVFCNNPLSVMLSTSMEGTVKNCTQGLMLFDGTIEENANTLHPPAGVSVVGCGSPITYSGANVMAGSYNDTESGFIDNGKGYKHVWDFTTSQANGTIKCASLTTAAGGKITEGTYPYGTGYVYDSEMSFFSNSSSKFWNPPLLADASIKSSADIGNILHIDGTGNRMLRAASYYEFLDYYSNDSSFENFKKSIFYKRAMDIQVHRIGLTKISIFESVDTYYATTARDNSESLIETVTVPMPDGLAALITDELLTTPGRYWGVEIYCEDDYIYIFIRIPTASGTQSLVMEPGDSAYIWKINIDDFTSTYYTFTNNTGKEISWQYKNGSTNIIAGAVGPANYIAVAGEYLFCTARSGGVVYRINMTDNTDVSVMLKPDGTEFSNAYVYFSSVYTANGRMYFSLSPVCVCDPVSGIVSYKNRGRMSSATVSAGNFSRIIKPRGVEFFVFGYYGMTNSTPYSFLMFAFDPTILVTINNLLTPVTKTASQSMKVTYSITMVDE